ncbi:MAG TPA: hypothetical protein ENF42_02000, partial [Candidatus Bathyarchaeota archaeon]|nr:hypothetical protein [Candidatus Bathyarchaeota archaeon]
MSDIVRDERSRRFRLILNILGIILSTSLLFYYIPLLKNAGLALGLAAGGILTLNTACSLAVYILD